MPIPANISFHAQGVSIDALDSKALIEWLEQVASEEKKRINQISYTFCSDAALLKINRQFLNHDYLTDILTFPYAYDPIEAEIFISIERVAENAFERKQAFITELKRVLVHGLLHMCGYNDHTEAESKVMRAKENHYIRL